MASKKKAAKGKQPKRFVLTIEVEGNALTVRDLRTLESIKTERFLVFRDDEGVIGASIVQVQVNRVRA